MDPRYHVPVTLTSTFTREHLLAWCTVWGSQIGRKLTTRCEDKLAERYLVIDITDAPRITRAHYPYSTMEVGKSFRVPFVAEKNLQTLRVWSGQQGKKLGRQFAVTTEDEHFVITRKA